jgi:tryptophan-rich sensory protein
MDLARPAKRGGRSAAVRKRRRTGSAAATKAECSASAQGELDKEALAKYAGAFALQLTALGFCCRTLDALGSAAPVPEGAKPWLIGALGSLLSIRSRWLNPLDNRRPQLSAEDSARSKHLRPSWQPPGVVFAVVWTGIAALRGAAMSIAWQAAGQHLFSLPILLYCLHLSVGDVRHRYHLLSPTVTLNRFKRTPQVWNHINVQERRYGVSTTGMAFVIGSATACAYEYYRYAPKAGLLLVPKLVWLCVAAILVAQIRALNGNPPLLPRTSESV